MLILGTIIFKIAMPSRRTNLTVPRIVYSFSLHFEMPLWTLGLFCLQNLPPQADSHGNPQHSESSSLHLAFSCGPVMLDTPANVPALSDSSFLLTPLHPSSTWNPWDAVHGLTREFAWHEKTNWASQNPSLGSLNVEITRE